MMFRGNMIIADIVNVLHFISKPNSYLYVHKSYKISIQITFVKFDSIHTIYGTPLPSYDEMFHYMMPLHDSFTCF